MNPDTYDNLSLTTGQELIDFSTQAETFGIDANQLAALLIAPLC